MTIIISIFVNIMDLKWQVRLCYRTRHTTVDAAVEIVCCLWFSYFIDSTVLVWIFCVSMWRLRCWRRFSTTHVNNFVIHCKLLLQIFFGKCWCCQRVRYWFIVVVITCFPLSCEANWSELGVIIIYTRRRLRQSWSIPDNVCGALDVCVITRTNSILSVTQWINVMI